MTIAVRVPASWAILHTAPAIKGMATAPKPNPTNTNPNKLTMIAIARLEGNDMAGCILTSSLLEIETDTNL